jgi:hypothetical protein
MKIHIRVHTMWKAINAGRILAPILVEYFVSSFSFEVSNKRRDIARDNPINLKKKFRILLQNFEMWTAKIISQ